MDTIVTAIWVQILNVVICISHKAKTLEKVMNPIILPPAMDK